MQQLTELLDRAAAAQSDTTRGIYADKFAAEFGGAMHDFTQGLGDKLGVAPDITPTNSRIR